jgi:hypothetical protein
MQEKRLVLMVAIACALIVLLSLTVVLQMPRVSRIWLGWLPQIVRTPLSRHFGPRPILHPDVPDPALFAPAPDADPLGKAVAQIAQILVSAMHGTGDAFFSLNGL